MPERCPPSRCEIHLKKSIDDGFKWAKLVKDEGICVELAEKAQEHYSHADEAAEKCAMREAFEHLRQADMERQKVLRCMELEDEDVAPTEPPFSSGSFEGLKLTKLGRRPALQGPKMPKMKKRSK